MFSVKITNKSETWNHAKLCNNLLSSQEKKVIVTMEFSLTSEGNQVLARSILYPKDVLS